MPYDPVITAIATTTNDALPDHAWRHDTADDGDPVAHVAVALCRAAYDLNTTGALLNRILTNVGKECARHVKTVADFATVYPHSLDVDAFRMLQQIERFDSQREALLALYALWRRHRPVSRDPRVRHLLVEPYNPSFGMVTLGADDADTGGTGPAWFVVPDAVAAQVHGLHSHGEIVGEIRLTDAGWQAAAYTHPEHRTTCPHLVYPLPAADIEAAACRALLRWWALRDSEQRQGRIPAQLTATEQAALTA